MSIWKQTADLDRINSWNATRWSNTSACASPTSATTIVRGTMPVDARTHQPFGLLHGGASVALAETLGSLAGTMCLDADTEMAVGLDINANHVRAVTDGVVTGTARAAASRPHDAGLGNPHRGRAPASSSAFRD